MLLSRTSRYSHPFRLRLRFSRIPAAWLMVGSSFSFACMGLCVKLASAGHHSLAEIVFYRGFCGALIMAVLMQRSGSALRTKVPALHFKRSVAGVGSLTLLFYAVSHLPLATAMTLNYLSSIWIVLFIMLSALFGRTAKNQHFDTRLMMIVLMGFGGVILVLRPSMQQHQFPAALVGLISSLLSAAAYLQVAALGKAGEPEDRVVFYFSVGGAVSGLMMLPFAGAGGGGMHLPTLGSALALIGSGAAATAAQLFLTRAYSIGKPMVNASLHYLGIAFSFLFGATLFGDTITAAALIGMVLIVMAGLTAAQLRNTKSTSQDKEFASTLYWQDDFPSAFTQNDGFADTVQFQRPHWN
jgi:S-adenosylmethionine uptake transporter